MAVAEGVRDSMIKFRCKNCGRKFSVPEIHAGKKGKCPKCKNIVVVPKPEIAASATSQNDLGASKVGSKNSAYDLTLLDVPQEDKIQDQPISQYTVSEKTIEPEEELEEGAAVEETELAGERKLPWLVDIFLYPMSKGGLTTLVVIIVLRLLTDLAAWLLACCIFGGILGLIIRIVIVWSYMYWYFAECIRDSANGGLRAPETTVAMPGLGTMVWQFLRLFACYAFFLGPVTFYRGYTFYSNTEANSVIFWSLLTYGNLFFPMGILAVVMFDSVNGLNPILIIRSIVSTFLQYCGLVILFYGLTVLFVILFSMVVSIMTRAGGLPSIFLSFIFFNVVFVYLLLVAGHLLGRFYWRYEAKLYWEV